MPTTEEIKLYTLIYFHGPNDMPRQLASSHRLEKLGKITPVTKWLVHSDPNDPDLRRSSSHDGEYPFYQIREVPFVN